MKHFLGVLVVGLLASNWAQAYTGPLKGYDGKIEVACWSDAGPTQTKQTLDLENSEYYLKVADLFVGSCGSSGLYLSFIGAQIGTVRLSYAYSGGCSTASGGAELLMEFKNVQVTDDVFKNQYSGPAGDHVDTVVSLDCSVRLLN